MVLWVLEACRGWGRGWDSCFCSEGGLFTGACRGPVDLEEVAETFDEYVALLPSVFDGTFSDPNHPNGFRRISVKKGVATIVGKDEPQDKKEWQLKASVTPGTREMLVDFSPKGGPKDLLAKWSPTKNGIEFPDGNVWPKQ